MRWGVIKIQPRAAITHLAWLDAEVTLRKVRGTMYSWLQNSAGIAIASWRCVVTTPLTLPNNIKN